MQGLLGNPVIQGLLTDPNTLRARARAEAAQMAPRGGGGMIGAPSPQQPQDSGWANALSSIGNSGAKLIEGLQANRASQKRVQSVLGMGNESRNAAMQTGGGPSNAAAAQMQVNPAQRLAQMGVPEKAQGLVMGAIEAGDWRTADQILTQFALAPSAERKVIKGADGYNYYQDTGERVLPGVKMAGNPNSPFNPDGTPNEAYQEYELRKALSGRSNNVTTVNNVTERESEFDKAVGKDLGAEFTGVQNAASAAQGTLNRVNTARNYLDKIETGSITPTLVGVKSLAKSFGVNLDALGIKDDVAPAEAFRAVTGQFLMDFIAQTKGSISEAENKLFQSFSPSLGNTKEGNKFLLDIASRKAKRDRDLATFANQYVKENGRLDLNWYDAKDEWLRKNTIATEEVLNRYEALGSTGNDTIGNTTVTTPGVSGSGQMGRGDWSIRKVD